MGLPLLPPLPGSLPVWKQNVSPSIDFGGLNDTIATITNGIETVKNTVEVAGTIRQTVLGKAQSWYSTAKAATGNINTVLNGFNGDIGALVSQTAGAISKGGVLEKVTTEFAGIFALASSSTAQLMAILNGSVQLDSATKATIQTFVTNLLSNLDGIKNTVLGDLITLTAQPDFIKTAKTHIETAVATLDTTVATFKTQIAGININAIQMPTEAGALKGLQDAGSALNLNPAALLTAVGDYAKSVKFKMISMAPVVGDLNTFRQALVSTLDGNYPNTPEDKGMYGAMVLFTTADGMVSAMTEWAKKSVLLFGSHKGMGELISHALSNPLLSPLGKLAEGTPLGSAVDNANIGKELPLPAMLQKFSTETMAEIKDLMDTGFLGDLISTDSPVAKFFNKEPSQTTIDRKQALEEKKVSLLPDTILEPVLNKIGAKDITDSITGITKDISKLGKNPENKWLDIKGPEDLFGAAGQQVDIMQKIIKDISGITPKIRNSIQLIFDSVKKEADSLADIKLPSLDEAKGEVDKISSQIGNINFDVLLLPPADGGLKHLRMKLTDWVSPAATNAPAVAGNTAMFAVMIVISAPSLNLGVEQLDALTKQFQLN